MVSSGCFTAPITEGDIGGSTGEGGTGTPMVTTMPADTGPVTTSSVEGTTSGGVDSTGTPGDSDEGTTASVDDGETDSMTSTGGSGDSGSSESTGEPSDCPVDPDEDFDMDGFSVNDGDCNDCDPNVNPNALEVEVTDPDPETGMVPAPADEDCDGVVDNVAPPCDLGLALDSTDPFDAAAAMGICKVASGPFDWGLQFASYVRADGTMHEAVAQHGLQTSFGPNVAPQEGSTLLNLSSGHARIPGQPDACGSLTCQPSGAGTPPDGFPQDVPACPGLDTINDDVALEVTLRAPSNATGYSFSFSFYSFEYPEWVCTSYNDQFIALVEPAPPGSINGNISFDSMANPVSVNVGFFDVCEGCALGTAELQGTGFDVWDDAGATGWLTTTAPIEPGADVTIRFAIWDTGDQAWDSSVILDNFRWLATGGNVAVGTE